LVVLFERLTHAPDLQVEVAEGAVTAKLAAFGGLHAGFQHVQRLQQPRLVSSRSANSDRPGTR
jgi:hypothetical protein